MKGNLFLSQPSQASQPSQFNENEFDGSYMEDCTPREYSQLSQECVSRFGALNHKKTLNLAPSPMRKSKRSRSFKVFGTNINDSALNVRRFDSDSRSSENSRQLPEVEQDYQSYFGMSQDSCMGNSQFSQDFSDRLCNMQLSQRDNNNTSDTDSRFSSYANDAYTLHAIPSITSVVSDISSFSVPKTSAVSDKEKEDKQRQVVLPPALVNPFLVPFLASTTNTTKLSIQRPTTMWIEPYKERSRYLSDFETVCVLGEGAFAMVNLCRRRLDGAYYAIKILKSKIIGEANGLKVTKEAQAHAALVGCPSLVRYFSCWFDDGIFHLQTEVCSVGTLDRFVSPLPTDSQASSDEKMFSQCTDAGDTSGDHSSPGLPQPNGIPEDLAWLIILNISDALRYMHSKFIAHLDLRPANVFIAGPIENEEVIVKSCKYNNKQVITGILQGDYTLRLGDLGHATRIDDRKPIEEGDERYCSKELIEDDGKRHVDLLKADVFSLGASVLELCLGRPLGYSGNDGSEEWHNIRNGNLDGLVLSHYSSDLVAFIKGLLDPNPLDRPDAHEVWLGASAKCNNNQI